MSKHNFLYPPGGILIWIIVLIEIITFSIGIGVFLYSKSLNQELFAESQRQLNVEIGTMNTILLLSGGLLMITSVKQLKLFKVKAAKNWLLATILTGVGFLGLKGYEYVSKLINGFSIDSTEFFQYYWLLTGFHFVHVLVAVFILMLLYYQLGKSEFDEETLQDLETSGIFWHMCDVIWILLFPVLYLIH